MPRRTAATSLLAATAVTATVLLSTSCSATEPTDRTAAVEPLGPSADAADAGSPPRIGRTPDPDGVASPSSSVPTPGATTGRPTNDPTDHPTGDDASVALAQSVLDRYDAALTTLAADPLAAAPGHPSLDAWHAVVVAQGSFSAAMLGDLKDRAAFESTVVVPGPDGRAYRHQVLRAVADGPSVSFTWCGHAPGLGVDTGTGEVVDDAVALSRGTGELSHDGTTWRVVTLDAFDLDVAAAGTADPCPAEFAATRRATDPSEVTE